MRLIKPILLLVTIFLFQTESNCQFFKKFDFEIGANRSKVINTKPTHISSSDNLNLSDRALIEQNESSSYTNSFNMSIGYQLSDKHHFRFRYSKNRLGSHLTGRFRDHEFFGCGVGTTVVSLRNEYNPIKSRALGATYEYQTPFFEGDISFEFGAEKHWYNYDDTPIIRIGYAKNSYVAYSAVGYIVPLFNKVKLHPKFFISKSIYQNYNYSDREFITNYLKEDGGEYVPLQIGIEMALRIDL